MEELPDIDRWLVTPQNPPRDVVGLDYERCAALHNYIFQYGWVSSGRHISDLVRESWFDRHHEEGDQLLDRLKPSVVNFLKRAYDHGDTERNFFYWAGGLNSPDEMWRFWPMFQAEGEEYRCLTLYRAKDDSHCDGLCYDQNRHRTIMYMTTDDHDFGETEDAEKLWFPLETVLSNWISVIRLGKITAEPTGVALGNVPYAPWLCHSYSSQQVEEAIIAFNRLIVAIESRMPSVRQPSQHDVIISNALLNAAGVRDPSFARSVLRSIRLPSFKFLAPGVLVPSVATFVQSQFFTSVQIADRGLTIPPVLLFPTVGTFEFHSPGPYELKPFFSRYSGALKGVKIPTGVYTTEIDDRGAPDTTEEGFQFILPYNIGENQFARRSDGTRFDWRGDCKDLYQHGFMPFGGYWGRPQRLVRLLDSWTRMVDDGLWKVGEEGVSGGIEKFKEADTENHWRDYWIEPDW